MPQRTYTTYVVADGFKVTVAAAGTPQQLSKLSRNARALLLHAMENNKGVVGYSWLGAISGGFPVTYANGFKKLAAGADDTLYVDEPSKIWLDAANTGDGVVVTVLDGRAFEAGYVNGDDSTVTADTTTPLIDNDATLTITVLDQHLKPIQNAAVTLSFTAPTPAQVTLTQPVALTDANGHTTGKIRSHVAQAMVVSIRVLSAQFDVTLTSTITITAH